jgi:hypothetical protein
MASDRWLTTKLKALDDWEKGFSIHKIDPAEDGADPTIARRPSAVFTPERQPTLRQPID